MRGNKMLLEYVTFLETTIYKKELDVDEYLCPLYEDREGKDFFKARVTTQYCEAMAVNKGCPKRNDCKEYKAQKELQKKYSDLDWEKICEFNQKMKEKIMEEKKEKKDDVANN